MIILCKNKEDMERFLAKGYEKKDIFKATKSPDKWIENNLLGLQEDKILISKDLYPSLSDETLLFLLRRLRSKSRYNFLVVENEHYQEEAPDFEEPKLDNRIQFSSAHMDEVDAYRYTYINCTTVLEG